MEEHKTLEKVTSEKDLINSVSGNLAYLGFEKGCQLKILELEKK